LSSTLIDELGYLALDQQTSNLFYQVISTRHSQKRSTIRVLGINGTENRVKTTCVLQIQ